MIEIRNSVYVFQWIWWLSYLIFFFFILYYSRKIECRTWYCHNHMKLYDNKWILTWVTYIIKISQCCIIIWFQFSLNLLYIFQNKMHFLYNEKLNHIFQDLICCIFSHKYKTKSGLQTHSRFFIALNHKELCLQALKIPSVQNTIQLTQI